MDNSGRAGGTTPPDPARAAHDVAHDGARGVLIGRPFGVPVYVTPTWFIIAALITYGFAGTVETTVPDIGPWKYAVSLTYAVLLYVSVFIHELSHTVVALRAGLPVRRISLYLLGGVSEIERPARTPGVEAWIAAAGPLVSLLLGVVGFAVSQLLEPDTVGRLLAGALMFSNLVVGVFNLLPGLPLDGGRVLSAAVWKVTGRRSTGSIVAAWLGRGVAVVVLFLPSVIAVAFGRAPGLLDLVWGGLLASFIWAGASQALVSANLQERIPTLSVRTLTRRAALVTAEVPLAEALRRAREAGAHALVVVDGDGAPTALVNEAAVVATPDARKPWVPVGDVARRLHPGMAISADLSGDELVTAITRVSASEFLVLDPAGAVVGVLSVADVERAVTTKA